MHFTVKHEFQHLGVNYEAGNSHKKHGLSDDTVLQFHRAGWVDVAEKPSQPSHPDSVSVQPDDLTIEINQGN
ncbi:MAG TPA: hypothetical protein VL995_11475 [Cellvibrio sp.]|nr:hypothetical protein [Cellvibrio sp.]